MRLPRPAYASRVWCRAATSPAIAGAGTVQTLILSGGKGAERPQPAVAQMSSVRPACQRAKAGIKFTTQTGTGPVSNAKSRMKIGNLLVACCISALPLGAQPARTADLILVNARVYTVDENRPLVSAFAVKDGRILFAGSEVEVRALAGPSTRVIDGGRATVIPGMVDAHAHLLNLGTSLRNVKLAGSRSYDEVVARVVERARTMKPGE